MFNGIKGNEKHQNQVEYVNTRNKRKNTGLSLTENSGALVNYKVRDCGDFFKLDSKSLLGISCTLFRAGACTD